MSLSFELAWLKLLLYLYMYVSYEANNRYVLLFGIADVTPP